MIATHLIFFFLNSEPLTSVALTGIAATAALGSLTATASAPMSGLSSTTALGSLTSDSDSSVALTGVRADSGRGNLGTTGGVGDGSSDPGVFVMRRRR